MCNKKNLPSPILAHLNEKQWPCISHHPYKHTWMRNNVLVSPITHTSIPGWETKTLYLPSPIQAYLDEKRLLLTDAWCLQRISMKECRKLNLIKSSHLRQLSPSRGISVKNSRKRKICGQRPRGICGQHTRVTCGQRTSITCGRRPRAICSQPHSPQATESKVANLGILFCCWLV